MPQCDAYDSVIVGAGINGLAAAITLARAGRSVCVLEEADAPGGCVRSDQGTLPGFIHDTGSAVFPMAIGTPFFSTLPEERFRVQWIIPPAALAHPFDDGSCITISRSWEETIQSLGEDGPAYARFVRPFHERFQDIASEILKPALHVPRHPVLFTLFGMKGIWPVSWVAEHLFRTEKGRALIAGMGAHSILPLSYPFTASFALFMIASAHATGWPIPKGGAGAISEALASYLTSLGGEIVLSHGVGNAKDLPPSRSLLFDLTPRQILAIAGGNIPEHAARGLARYHYGPGVFKIDWALDGPIPWKARECAKAGTVHLGGTYEEIALSERSVWKGVHPERPFVLCVQPSLFDDSRAPAGRHTAWAYCHVPGGSGVDMTQRIEQQMERFAPGFTQRILGRRILSPSSLERINANLVGGDISGGANSFPQLFFRPYLAWPPYRLSREGTYLCSSSTPPGGGVHGMCGYNAARILLGDTA